MSKWAVNWKTVGQFLIGGVVAVIAAIPIRKLRWRSQEVTPATSKSPAPQTPLSPASASPPGGRHPTPTAPVTAPIVPDTTRPSVSEEQYEIIVKNVEDAKGLATGEFKKGAWEKAAVKYIEVEFWLVTL